MLWDFFLFFFFVSAELHLCAPFKWLSLHLIHQPYFKLYLLPQRFLKYQFCSSTCFCGLITPCANLFKCFSIQVWRTSWKGFHLSASPLMVANAVGSLPPQPCALPSSAGFLSCSQARRDTLCNPSNMFWVCLRSPPSWKYPLKYLHK